MKLVLNLIRPEMQLAGAGRSFIFSFALAMLSLFC